MSEKNGKYSGTLQMPQDVGGNLRRAPSDFLLLGPTSNAAGRAHLLFSRGCGSEPVTFPSAGLRDVVQLPSRRHHQQSVLVDANPKRSKVSVLMGELEIGRQRKGG